MFKRLFFVAVLCTTLMVIFLTNANAWLWYQNIWGAGATNPYYVDHKLKGGQSERATATVDTVWEVLKGDLVLRNPNDKIVLAGVGFSVPALVSSTTEGLEPDENGNFILRQLLPRTPEDCLLAYPDGSPLIPGCYTKIEAEAEQRFFDFWFPDDDYEDVVKNNSRILELRIELSEIRVHFYGDFAKQEIRVETRFKACLELRAEEWPDAFTFIERDEGEPFACDDAYTTNKTLKVPAPGVFKNDYDHEGDVLAVHSVDDFGLQGTLTMDENGRFQYTPPEDWYDEDSFSYVAVDSQGYLSNEAIVTITVNQK